VCLESGLQPADVPRRPYADYVRECVDVLIEHGADRYGSVRAPILVAILDVRDRVCPENPLPLDEELRVNRRDRRAPAGANLWLDQETLRVMYDLTRRTGQPRYARFADKYLDYYLAHLVDDKGLIWWGWHRHYDVYKDVMTGHAGNSHEIHYQRARWPELFAINRHAVTREIEAIWQWHVVDKQTGEINRHADGQHGCNFAFTAGEILRSFAFLYHETGDRKWLDRAKLLADYYWHRRNPATNLVAMAPRLATRYDGRHFDTTITGLYCSRLLDAFEWTKDAQFRDQAVAYLKAYARYGFDSKTGKFWGSLRLDGTPEPGPRVLGSTEADYQRYEPRGHVDLWQPYAGADEQPLGTARTYVDAAKLTGDAELIEAARRWAECIRQALPPGPCLAEAYYEKYARTWAPHGTYAGYYGQTIAFFVGMSRLTGEAKYGDLARSVANEAVAKLYYRGLFRGHPCKPYYEAMDDVGVFLEALLQLSFNTE
jgi:hypothetical protein